jgi:hypothetical protein
MSRSISRSYLSGSIHRSVPGTYCTYPASCPYLYLGPICPALYPGLSRGPTYPASCPDLYPGPICPALYTGLSRGPTCPAPCQDLCISPSPTCPAPSPAPCPSPAYPSPCPSYSVLSCTNNSISNFPVPLYILGSVVLLFSICFSRRF